MSGLRALGRRAARLRASGRALLEAEAVAWFIRLRAGADAERESFVAWLEGDPARASVYDEVEATDAQLPEAASGR